MPFQEHEPLLDMSHSEDLRYGMTVPEILREIDSPIFDEVPEKPEIPPLDQNDRVFYGQFLTQHFDEGRDLSEAGVAAIELYNDFFHWREKALRSVDPKKTKFLNEAYELAAIYKRLNISDLLRHVEMEVSFALEPKKPGFGVLFGCADWLLIERVVECAVTLEEELHRVQDQSSKRQKEA